jgi:hypothetical protein
MRIGPEGIRRHRVAGLIDRASGFRTWVWGYPDGLSALSVRAAAAHIFERGPAGDHGGMIIQRAPTGGICSSRPTVSR